MADFYSDMADMAAELLSPTSEGGLGQGLVTLERDVDTGVPIDPDRPWLGTVRDNQTATLKAAVKRVNQRFDKGTLIVQTGDIVTFAPIGFEPSSSDTLTIDGQQRVITDIKRIPAAGTVAVWQIFTAA